MQMKWRYVWLAIFLGLLLPWILIMNIEKNIETPPSTYETFKEPERIHVQLPDQTIVEMDMDTYVLGVLFGEMPSNFEPEALKAQAVAARTFAKRSMIIGSKHNEFDICTNSNCCQSYADPNMFKDHTDHYDKFYNAVNETRGLYLFYKNSLAETTYFSCSGGKTEDAVAVWGTNVPYLKSVDSPGEEKAVHYISSKSFTVNEFITLLGDNPSGLPETWIGDISYTQGGGVDTIQIGAKTYSGTQIRQLLGLKSTAFHITALGDKITVTTKGFGHRVGMSQYGADAMAAAGSTYEQILAYYYPGTVLKSDPDI